MMNLRSVWVLLTGFISINSSRVEEACSVEKCVGPSVAALVPARAGSKGVKHKNLSRIGNDTLLSRTLRTIHKAQKFDSVWVSTDGEEIANEALDHGAKIHWRDPATATDNATTISAVQDFLKFHNDISIIAVIQCTSPFLKEEFLIDALHRMITSSLDCVFSATRVFSLRWTKSPDGLIKPLNFNPRKRPRRQDWDGELIENGMFYILKKELVAEGVFQNDRCDVLEVPKYYSMEIDTPNDLMIATALSALIDSKTIA